MPYTLSMALFWVALAILLGILIGWLMRSVVAQRQIERARSNHLDMVEMERLRARIASLEPAVAERDRLRVELEACRAAGGIGQVGEDTASRVTPDQDSVATAVASPGASTVTGEPALPEVVAALADVDAFDLGRAATVLGRRISADDLTVIAGIGPKIAELCHGIGIRTWTDLAETEPSLLRTMLADAGPRFRTHDPDLWPRQAALLAEGRWQEFKALTDHLEPDRSADPT